VQPFEQAGGKRIAGGLKRIYQEYWKLLYITPSTLLFPLFLKMKYGNSAIMGIPFHALSNTWMLCFAKSGRPKPVRQARKLRKPSQTSSAAVGILHSNRLDQISQDSTPFG